MVQNEAARRKQRVAPLYLVIMAVCGGLTIVLDAAGTMIGGYAPGASWFYPAGIVSIPMGVLFGMWGNIGHMIGTIIGGLVTGMPLPLALMMKSSNILHGIPAMLLMKGLHADPRIKTRRDAIICFIGGCLVYIPGSFWGLGVLVWQGFIPLAGLPYAYMMWTLPGILEGGVLGTLLLKATASMVMRTRLYIERYW